MVKEKNRCVIVSASPQRDNDFIKSNINSDDFVICADGGADYIISCGIVPDLIIGDFDSCVSKEKFSLYNTIKLPTRKDDTDTYYCIKYALNLGYKDFLLLGSTGGRLDHTLASLSILLFLKKSGAVGIISDEFNSVSLLESGITDLCGMRGRTVSVMPFACESICVSYEGMRYPLTESVVKTEYPFSISNVVESDRAIINLHKGNALLIIPND